MPAGEYRVRQKEQKTQHQDPGEQPPEQPQIAPGDAPLRLAYGPDRRLSCLLFGEGGGGAARSLEQLHQGYIQCLGQGLQQLQVGKPLSGLPFAYRLVGDMEAVGQLQLGHLMFFSQLSDKCSELNVFHIQHGSFLVPPLCLHPPQKATYEK